MAEQKMNREWHEAKLAPLGEVLETKLDDEHGERNNQLLIRNGRLWFFPDMSMYVYYTPTHWRLPTPEQIEELASNADIKAADWRTLAERYRHRASLMTAAHPKVTP